MSENKNTKGTKSAVIFSIKLSGTFAKVYHNLYQLLDEYPALKLQDILVLAEIINLNNTKDGCIASDAYLEKLLHTNNIDRNIKRLADAGIITKTKYKGIGTSTNRRTITVNLGQPQNDESQPQINKRATSKVNEANLKSDVETAVNLSDSNDYSLIKEKKKEKREEKIIKEKLPVGNNVPDGTLLSPLILNQIKSNIHIEEEKDELANKKINELFTMFQEELNVIEEQNHIPFEKVFYKIENKLGIRMTSDFYGMFLLNTIISKVKKNRKIISNAITSIIEQMKKDKDYIVNHDVENKRKIKNWINEMIEINKNIPQKELFNVLIFEKDATLSDLVRNVEPKFYSNYYDEQIGKLTA